MNKLLAQKWQQMLLSGATNRCLLYYLKIAGLNPDDATAIFKTKMMLSCAVTCVLVTYRTESSSPAFPI